MERCLKKLVLEAEATGFQDPKRVAGSLWDRLGENIVLGGLDWRQMGVYSQPPEGQKVYSGSEESHPLSLRPRHERSFS
jgi:hypothetical protein